MQHEDKKSPMKTKKPSHIEKKVAERPPHAEKGSTSGEKRSKKDPTKRKSSKKAFKR